MSGSRSSLGSSTGFFGGLRDALRKPGAPWIALWIAVVSFALVLAFAGGCARTVLVPEASPIRIGPQTKARVYVLSDDKWVLGDNAVTIPEGWYCVPPSFVEEEQ